ncbi:MAG: MBL fold metallo-hydrolase [Phycisphaerae bacterium]|nr:MBL fold metallo-hydrolase [Phycisphaerae bacterium]
MSQPNLNIHVTNDPVYMQNGMVVSLRENGPCWIVDPGLPPQAEQMIEHIEARKLVPQAVVLTHAHADHIAGIDDVRESLGSLPVYLARPEWAALTDPMENLSGLMGPGLVTNVTDPCDLAPGDTLELDGTKWQVFDTSGHSPGGRSLYCAALGVVIVGDALFAGSVGRVDFPHSDGEKLMRNIRENLMTLPDETRVLSGHGPATTIGRERRSNPFVLHGI